VLDSVGSWTCDGVFKYGNESSNPTNWMENSCPGHELSVPKKSLSFIELSRNIQNPARKPNVFKLALI
jgi:hypothetical protein